MADCVGVYRFSDAELAGEELEPVLHSPITEATWFFTEFSAGDEQRSICVMPLGVHIHPCLEIRNRADQPQPSHPCLSAHDDYRPVTIELYMPDV